MPHVPCASIASRVASLRSRDAPDVGAPSSSSSAARAAINIVSRASTMAFVEYSPRCIDVRCASRSTQVS